jgi:hypothetical protein
MTRLSEAEERYPGITKHGCFNPYYDYEMMSPKCMACLRQAKCRKESALEIMRAAEELDESHHPYALRAREDLEFRKKKKSAKPKQKRKCRCKK